jgi:IclR family pca regulon transcriptional regulator
MQNTIHPRDLIVGLQKGLALIQLFPKPAQSSPSPRRRK